MLTGASRAKTVPLLAHPCCAGALGYIRYSVATGSPGHLGLEAARQLRPPRSLTGESPFLRAPCLLSTVHTHACSCTFFRRPASQDTTSQNRPPFPKHNLPRSPFLQINTPNPRPDSNHSAPTASITAPIAHSPRKNCRVIRYHGRDPPKTRHRRRRCLR